MHDITVYVPNFLFLGGASQPFMIPSFDPYNSYEGPSPRVGNEVSTLELTVNIVREHGGGALADVGSSGSSWEVGEQLKRKTPWLFRVYLEMNSYPSYVGIFQKLCKDLY